MCFKILSHVVLKLPFFLRSVAEMSGSQPSFAVPGTNFSPLASWVLHHHPNLFGGAREITRICIRFPSANSVIGEASWPISTHSLGNLIMRKLVTTISLLLYVSYHNFPVYCGSVGGVLWENHSWTTAPFLDIEWKEERINHLSPIVHNVSHSTHSSVNPTQNGLYSQQNQTKPKRGRFNDNKMQVFRRARALFSTSEPGMTR